MNSDGVNCRAVRAFPIAPPFSGKIAVPPIVTALIAVLLLVHGSVLAACPGWQVSSSTDYDGPAHSQDQAAGVAVDGSGNVFVVGGEGGLTGHTNWRIRKYDAGLGTVLASTDYDAGSGSSPRRVALDTGGNVVVLGDAVVRKYDAGLATLLWSRTLSWTPSAFALDGSDNVVLVGTLSNDWKIVKYDASLGALMASTTYNGPANGGDGASTVAVDGSGNIYVAGVEAGIYGGANWRINKYDPNLGALLASVDYNGPAGDDDSAYCMAIGGDGSVVVAGYEEIAWWGEEEWCIRKYDASLGTVLGSTPYWSNDSFPYGVAVDGKGNIFVAGSTNGGAGYDYWTVREYDPNLTTLLGMDNFKPGYSDRDQASAIALDPSGNAIAVGYEEGPFIHNNWRLRKYSSARACLTGALTANPPSPLPGQWFQVAATVANNGNADATGLVPSLQAVSGASRVAYEDGPLPPGPVTLAPGSSTTFVWTYSASGSGSVMYSLTVTGTDSGTGNPIVNAYGQGMTIASVTVIVSAVKLQDPVSGSTVFAGAPVTYRIVVANTGTTTVTDLAVVDTVSPVVVGQMASQPAPFGSPAVAGVSSGTRYMWSATGLTMAPGIRYTFTVTGIAGTVYAQTQVTNAACISASGAYGSYATLSSGVSFYISVPAQILASAVSAPLPVAVGQAVSVALTVQNTGGTSASGVRPALELNAGGALVSPVSGPQPAGPVVIPPGGSQAFAWVFSAVGEGVAAFTATATGSAAGTGAPLVAAVSGVMVISGTGYGGAGGGGGAALASACAVSPARLKEGDGFEVALTVTNTGTAGASGVVPSLVFSDATIARVSAGPSPAGPAAIAAGASTVFRWQLTAERPGTLSLTAAASGSGAATQAQGLVTVLPGSAGTVLVYPNPVSGDSATIVLPLEDDAEEVYVKAYNSSNRLAATALWRSVSRSDGSVVLTGIRSWAPGVYVLIATAKTAGAAERSFAPAKLVVRR